MFMIESRRSARGFPDRQTSKHSRCQAMCRMRLWSGFPRVAHTLPFMYAPHEQVRHLFCQRVLSLACPGFLRVADIKGDVGATPVCQCMHHPCGPGPPPPRCSGPSPATVTSCLGSVSYID